METTVLTTMLTSVEAIFEAGFVRLQPTILWLLGVLCAIEIVWIGLLFAEGQESGVNKIFRKIFFIMFWGYLVTNYTSLSDVFVEGMQWAGKRVGGGSIVCAINDPSCILGYGLQATKPISDFAKENDPSVLDSVALSISMLGIFIAYLAAALQMCMIITEWAVIKVIAGFLLPFGVLEKTNDIGQKSIAAIIAMGVKIMTVTMILFAIEPVISQVTSASPIVNGEISYNKLFTIMGASWFMALLVWTAPNIATGMLGGSPTLAARDMVRSAAGTAGGAAAGLNAALSAPGASWDKVKGGWNKGRGAVSTGTRYVGAVANLIKGRR